MQVETTMYFFHSVSIRNQKRDHISKIVLICWHYNILEFLFIGMLALPFVLRWFVPHENLGAFYRTAAITNFGLSILAFCFAVDLRKSWKRR